MEKGDILFKTRHENGCGRMDFTKTKGKTKKKDAFFTKKVQKQIACKVLCIQKTGFFRRWDGF